MNTLLLYTSILAALTLAIDLFFRKDKSIVSSVLHSFHNEPKGFSARKISAFAAVMVSLYITIKYVTTETLEGVLTIWLLFGLLCLGIITFEQIIRFKGVSPQQEPKKDEPQSAP